jgi:3-oxoadipate enol-lactonase
MVSLWAAIHAPERVRSLVPCFTSACLGPPSAWAERAALVRSQGTAAVADAVVARWFTAAFADAQPDVVRRFRDMIAATPAAGYASCCAVVETMDLRPSLAAVAAPTLVVAGAEDPAIPLDHAELIAARVQHAQLAVLEGAAHLGNVEQPEAFNRLLLGHLAATLP